MNYSEITSKLSSKGLKITPQRVAVLDALMELKYHPSADDVKEYVHKRNPNMALGTVYNILETFCERGIIKKVKTEKDFMRYDIETRSHHHVYFEDSDTIENYHDEELDKLLMNYFTNKQIENIDIKEINLQIIGRSKNTINR